MPIIVCLCLLAEDRPDWKPNYFGKRKLYECGKPMAKVNDFLFSCPDGHKRYYPAEKREIFEEAKNFSIIISEKLEVHHR